jgi:hypothetical protein
MNSVASPANPEAVAAGGASGVAMAGMIGGGLGGPAQLRPPAFPIEDIPPEVWKLPPLGGSAARTAATDVAADVATDVAVNQAERAVATRAAEEVVVRAGGRLISEEVLATVGTLALADEWNPVGWVLDGVFVVLVVVDMVGAYQSLQTTATTQPVPAEAPGATSPGVRIVDPTPVTPLIGPPVAPAGPMGAPGQGGGPVSLPGSPASDEPPSAVGPSFSPPTNRTDFPTQSDAYGAAVALLPTSGRRSLERTEQIHGTPQEIGTVEYWRYHGPATTIGSGAVINDGDLISIVWHGQDPSQYPHYHVVLPPPVGKTPIEFGGIYSEPFEGTPNQHLSVNPTGMSKMPGPPNGP